MTSKATTAASHFHLSRPMIALGTSAALLVYTAVLRYLQHYAILKALHDFWPPLVVLAVFLASWGAVNLPWNNHAWKAAANRVCLPLGVFLIIYTAYHHLGCWLGWVVTLPQTYWDQLAVSFLHGKLYLEAPTYFHDLTLYQGHWFVPQPPLPALILVPITLLLGAGNLNMVRISIFFAALNALLIYWILEQAARLEWIRLGRAGRLWIVALFAFGNPHLYVGINGMVWFLSQTLTVTFIALAALVSLKSWPAWLAGLCLAAAVAARPDVAVAWPMLAGIYLTFLLGKWPTPGASTPWREWAGVGGGDILGQLRPALLWTIQSTLPVILAVGGLLWYNHARFDSWLDFGYVTINGSDQIIHDVQAYGIFNPYFIPRNLNVLLLGIPEIRLQAPYIFPSRDGMSLLLTTPAFIYLFRRQKMNAWKLGALASVLLNLCLLVMYHNTGNFQFGYSYLLDFLVPLLLLLAAGFEEKLPRLFTALVLLSIAINLLGTIWFAYNW